MKLSYRTEQKYRVGTNKLGRVQTESREHHFRLSSSPNLELRSWLISVCFASGEHLFCDPVHHRISPLHRTPVHPRFTRVVDCRVNVRPGPHPSSKLRGSQFARNARHKTYIVSPNSLCSFHVRLSTFESSPGSLFLPALRKIEHSAHYRR